MWDPEFGPNVLRMIITNHGSPLFVRRIRTALNQMGAMLGGVTYDMVDKFEGDVANINPETTDITCLPTGRRDKLMEVINLLNFVMDRAGHRFRGGIIVRRDPRSTAAYTIETTVRDYLNDLCSVDEYRHVVTPKIDSVVSFFKNNPSYKGVKQIKVDLNLIEVRTIPLVTVPNVEPHDPRLPVIARTFISTHISR